MACIWNSFHSHHLLRLQFLLLLVDILQLVRQELFRQILELQLLKRLRSLICLRSTLAFLCRRRLHQRHQRRHQLQYLVVGTPLEELGVKSVVFVDGLEITEEELVTYAGEFGVGEGGEGGEEEIETRQHNHSQQDLRVHGLPLLMYSLKRSLRVQLQ